MPRSRLSLVARSRLAIALLLLAGLFCFGLGQVLGHPLSATPPASRVSHQTQAEARQIGAASGALAATPASALSLPMPLAAPPARPASSAKPPAHQHSHAKGGHTQDGTGGGASGLEHGNGDHHSHEGNSGDNGNGNVNGGNQ